MHRDLKPENVMVKKDGLVKILDFGLAKLSSTGSGSGEGSQLPTMTGTQPGVVVGTVGYMSPEQASGATLDFRSDQFSLGAMLYEMATGKRAFQRKTAIDTLAAILNEEPAPIAELNPQTPAPLRWIVERCLSKDPEGRYASTKDLARELGTIRDHLSETSGFAEVAAAGGRRRRIPTLAVSLAALAAGILAGTLLRKAPAPPLPRFQQLTFGEEAIQTARFAPDGQTIIYGATQPGKPFELFSTRVGSFESRPLGLNADILSISSKGEMALLLGGPGFLGTLAQAPLAGGAPREILENAVAADWSSDGKRLAVVHRVDGKDRLEYPIGTVLIPEGITGRPRFSGDGKTIAVRVGRSLSAVDVQTRRVRLLLNTDVLELSWSAKGDELWGFVRAGATSELRAFKPGGAERLVATLPGNFILHDIAAGGRVLAERVAPRGEMVALAPGQTQERSLTWLDASIPYDISPDGRTVLFTEMDFGAAGVATAYLRKTDGSAAVRLGEGRAMALSPDGKWALVQRGAEIVLMPTGAGEPRSSRAETSSSRAAGRSFPDGKRVLLSGRAAGVSAALRVGVRNGPAAAGDCRRRLPSPGDHTISPDGRLVAAQDAKGNWAIFSLDVPGSTSRAIAGLRPGRNRSAGAPTAACSSSSTGAGRYSGSIPPPGTASSTGSCAPGTRFRSRRMERPTSGATASTVSNLMLIEGLK